MRVRLTTSKSRKFALVCSFREVQVHAAAAGAAGVATRVRVLAGARDGDASRDEDLDLGVTLPAADNSETGDAIVTWIYKGAAVLKIKRNGGS
jgi:hypothetical protein